MSEELERAEPAQTTEESPIFAFNANLAAIKEVLQENLGVGGMTEFDLQHIKVPSGGGLAFDITDIDGDSAEAKITGAIMFARDRRAYWPKSGDETPAGVAPDCHSFDGVTGIGVPGGECKFCPNAQWGSALNGKGQACKATKQLVIFREGCKSMLPDILTLPPTSLQPYRTMAQRLGGGGISITSVVVEIGLVREKNPVNGKPYSVATFKVLRRLTPYEKAASTAFSAMYAPMFDAAPLVPLSAPRAQESGRLIDTVADEPTDEPTGAPSDPAFE